MNHIGNTLFQNSIKYVNSRQHDAYATVISGAGPTILTLCPKEKVVN